MQALMAFTLVVLAFGSIMQSVRLRRLEQAIDDWIGEEVEADG